MTKPIPTFVFIYTAYNTPLSVLINQEETKLTLQQIKPKVVTERFLQNGRKLFWQHGQEKKENYANKTTAKRIQIHSHRLSSSTN